MEEEAAPEQSEVKTGTPWIRQAGGGAWRRPRGSAVQLPTPDPDKPMNVYDDATAAFDDLVAWLKLDPYTGPPYDKPKPSPWYAEDYSASVVLRVKKAGDMVKAVAAEGHDIPNNYVWKTFWAFAYEPCSYEADEHCYDDNERKEMLRTVRAARDDLGARIKVCNPSEEDKAAELARLHKEIGHDPTKTYEPVTHAPSAFGNDYDSPPRIFEQEDWQAAAIKEGLLQPDIVVPVPTPEKKRENVGYGWPIKLLVSGAGAGGAYQFILPHILNNTSDSYMKDRVTLTLAVFGVVLTVANLIRKP